MSFRHSFSGLNLAPERQVALLIRVTALAIACSFLLSWKLWVSSRLFPLVPISNHLPAIPYPLDYIGFVSLLVLLAVISFFTRSRTLILVFLGLAGALALWDQMRWQPWFYQYLFMLAAVGLLKRRQTETPNNHAALDACRLIVASTYFWTGFQKLNVTFVRETWPDMASFLPSFCQSVVKQVPSYAILVIPLLEILIGFGLLTRRFRNRAVVLAIATHVAILILLFLTGENIVVWPWNIAMVLFVCILFWQDKKTTARRILVGKRAFQWLILLLFGLLPALSLVGLWDSFLSSSIYSGNTYQAAIYLSPAVMSRLPAPIRPHIWQSSEPFFLDINRWAYAELHVPVYPEPRIYRRVARRICQYAAGVPKISLWIRQKPDLVTGSYGSEYYDCETLD
ncbi:MAG: hypothetical protein ABR611_01680 [Chthoniobacterales bacterium]